MRSIRPKVIWTSIILMISLVGCTTKTIVKREIVIPNSPRYQAIIDSMRVQISDCEKALDAWSKFEDFNAKKK